MRQKIIAGNWKMNGSVDSSKGLLLQLSAAQALPKLIVFPPFPYLNLCSLSHIEYGAQNCAMYADGAYTGEVSAKMLKDVGCAYVILGHSERRMYFFETNEVIQKKCEQAFLAGLKPILCVGETEPQRQAGETLRVVQEQLAVLVYLKDNCSAFSDIIVAYEPVWAIGTGKSATPEDAEQVHAFIRSELSRIDDSLGKKTSILYGGSVTPSNAAALFKMPNIDGALVGGASLEVSRFLKIAECMRDSE